MAMMISTRATATLTRSGSPTPNQLGDGLRALLIANNGVPLDERAVAALDAEARAAPLGVELGGGAPSFVPLPGRLDGALSLVLSIVARSMLDGAWLRFKACRDDHCR